MTDKTLEAAELARLIAIIREWRPVIEAAKAAKEHLIYYVGDTGSVLVGDLLDAVEALQEVEGE